MSIAEPTSILDLLTPPKGYAFHAGIWLTHDLDWAALCDLVAPALTEVSTTGDRRMHDVRAAVGADAPGLVVLHAGGEHFTGGPALPWAREVAVAGRRQHAKAGLLLYRSPSGRKLRTKAFVTSANLTRSGLTSNLEVVTWDEHGSASTPFIGVDLFKEIAALTKSLPGGQVTRAVNKSLRAALRGIEPTRQLTSSLQAATTMVPPRHRNEPPASSVVVVSPAFAGNTDTKAAAALAPWCGPETTVSIYAPFNGTRALAASGEAGLELSKGLLSELRKTGATVTVHAVPALDDDALASRRLHAKVLVITRANGSTLVLSGSANCTGPGLEGQNREMMVRQYRSARQVATMLDGLDAVRFKGPIEPPPPKVPKPTVAPAAAVSAVFEIDSTARADGNHWTGILTVTVEGDEAVAITYNGQSIAAGEPVPVTFLPSLGTIEIRSGGRSCFAQVHVEAPPANTDFWNQLTPERQVDRPHRDLVRLLRDIDKPTRARPVAQPGAKSKAAVAADDGFSIPLGQRLVLIARLRRSLRDRNHNDMATLLDDYLDARTDKEKTAGVRAAEVASSRATALAVHGAYDRTAPTPKHKLLRSLRDAVESFDRLLDAEQEAAL